MGATASHSATSDDPPSKALHVLRVIPGSPASLAGIQVFFDFIVGIEGNVAGHSAIDAQSLERIVESHEGRTLNLVVWSSKFRSTRMVTITPSRKWALTSSSTPNGSAQPSLLGLSMRICEPETALDHVWHILEILEGSPAESAGLVPYGDWIVGWSGGVLSKEGDFYDIVEQHEEKPLRVYVYSYDFDTLREVVLVPNRMWGGEGLLGCGVGYGLLHRIPQVQPNTEDGDVDIDNLGEPPQDEADGGRRQSLFVPADEYPEYDASSAINGRQPPHSHHSHPDSHSHHHPHSHSHPHTHDHHHDVVFEDLSNSPVSPPPRSSLIRSNAPSPSPQPQPIPTPALSVAAPIPTKPLSIAVSSSSSGTRTPNNERVAEYRRRSSTPDALKHMVSPRLDDIGIRRVGSPRLASFGMGVGIAGMERKPSQTMERKTSQPSPSTPRASVTPSTRRDDSADDGTSEGETMGGSITSVD